MRKKNHGRTSGRRQPTARKSGEHQPLSAQAQKWLEEARTSLTQGGGSAADDNRLVAALAQLHDSEILPVTSQLAATTGAQSLSLLQCMAAQDDPRLSYAATEALGMVEELEAAAILGGIHQNSADKRLRKLARRSLMRLRSLGLEVEPFLPGREDSFDTTQIFSSTPSAWVSTISGAGDQMVIYSRMVPLEGHCAMHVMTNDKLGITFCTGGRTSRRRLLLGIDQMAERREFFFVQVEPDYAAYLLNCARELHEVLHGLLPKEFVSLNSLLNVPEVAANPVDVHSMLKVEESAGEAAGNEKPELILREEEFTLWLLSRENVQKCLQEIAEIEHGWVVTSEHVKEERIKNVLNSATDFIFSMGERRFYQARLEKMAYLLHLMGKTDTARHALAIAEMLGDETREAHTIPFARLLLTRSILYYSEKRAQPHEFEQEEEDEHRVILPEDIATMLRSTVP